MINVEIVNSCYNCVYNFKRAIFKSVFQFNFNIGRCGFGVNWKAELLAVIEALY